MGLDPIQGQRFQLLDLRPVEVGQHVADLRERVCIAQMQDAQAVGKDRQLRVDEVLKARASGESNIERVRVRFESHVERGSEIEERMEPFRYSQIAEYLLENVNAQVRDG